MTYKVKSREEYAQKMARGSAMRNHKTMQFFEMVERLATHNCSDLIPPAERL